MSEEILSGSIEIREGNEKDVVELVSLANRADEARLELVSDAQSRGEESFRKALEKIKSRDFWTRLAVLDGKVAGFISGEPTIDEKSGEKIEGVEHIKTLVVDPEAWGKGIGKSLVSEAIEVSRKKGRKQVELWTHESNLRAQRLYEGKGFKFTGERKKSEQNEWIIHYSLDI